MSHNRDLPLYFCLWQRYQSHPVFSPSPCSLWSSLSLFPLRVPRQSLSRFAVSLLPQCVSNVPPLLLLLSEFICYSTNIAPPPNLLFFCLEAEKTSRSFPFWEPSPPVTTRKVRAYFLLWPLFATTKSVTSALSVILFNDIHAHRGYDGSVRSSLHLLAR